jgi:MFS family permease
VTSDRWLVGWFLGYAAVGGASLLYPLYALDFGAGPLLVGLLASTAALAGVPGAVLWGWLAARTDRRRPFVLVALLTAGAVLLLTPLLDTPETLLVGNATLWFVVSAAAPVLNLLMVEGVPESEWNTRIGLLNAYQGYGWVAGLLLGTLWTTVLPGLVPATGDVVLLFPVLGVVALLGAGVVAAFYPERSVVSVARFQRGYRRLSQGGWEGARFLRTIPFGPGRLYWALRTRRAGDVDLGFTHPLRVYLFAVALFSTGFAAFWGPIPAFLTGEGFSDGGVFGLFLLANLGSASLFTRVGRATTHPLSLQSLALAGRVVLFPAVAAGASLAVGRTLALAVCFLLIGVTWAVIAVTSTGLVTRLAPTAVRGNALGAYTAVVGVGTAVGSILGGAVAAAAGYLLAFLGAALLVFLGAALALTTRDGGARGFSESVPNDRR